MNLKDLQDFVNKDCDRVLKKHLKEIEECRDIATKLGFLSKDIPAKIKKENEPKTKP